jgi:hypothetical protein
MIALDKPFEAIGRPLGIAAAIAYGMGVLIANLFLSGYGVFGGALLRTEYVLVGLLWCFLTLLPAVAFSLIQGFWRDVRQAVAARRYFGAAVPAALIPIALLLFPSMFFDRLSGGALKAGDLDFYGAIIYLCSGSYFFKSLVTDVQTATAADSPLDALKKGHLYSVSWNLMLLLGSITSYARFTYPHFEAAFGGGHRPRVFVVLSADAPSAIVRALPRARRSPGVLGPVEVLLEGEREFFLIPSPVQADAKAIMVPRDLVRGMVPALP